MVLWNKVSRLYTCKYWIKFETVNGVLMRGKLVSHSRTFSLTRPRRQHNVFILTISRIKISNCASIALISVLREKIGFKFCK